MALTEKLRKDMFEARKSANQAKADILSMAIASLANAKIAAEGELSEEKEIEVLRKEAKKLQDAAAEYTKAGAKELADKEMAQLGVINSYLPQLMSAEDVEKVVSSKISELGAAGPADTGKVMGAVMQELKGKADGGVVNETVKKLLAK
jgi:uncharacterized protein YqeY